MNTNQTYLNYLWLVVVAYLGGCVTSSVTETTTSASATTTSAAFSKESLALEGKDSSSQESMNAKKIVVEIYDQHGKSGGTGFVTAVLNNKAYILTAAHWVENNRQPKVNIFFLGDHNAKVLHIDEPHDLALLVVESEDLAALEVPYSLPKNNELTKAGDALFTVGFPQAGKLWAYQTLSYTGMKQEHLMLTGDTIDEGNSGGPVINGNNIIGMIVGKSEGVYAIPSRIIRNFLQGVGTEGRAILAQQDKRLPVTVVAKEKVAAPTRENKHKSVAQSATSSATSVKQSEIAAGKSSVVVGKSTEKSSSSSATPVTQSGKNTESATTKPGTTTGVATSATTSQAVLEKKPAAAQGKADKTVVPVKSASPVSTPSEPVTPKPQPTLAAGKTVTPTTSKPVTQVEKKPEPADIKKETPAKSATSVATAPVTATPPPKPATTVADTATPAPSKPVTQVEKKAGSVAEVKVAEVKKESVNKKDSMDDKKDSMDKSVTLSTPSLSTSVTTGKSSQTKAPIKATVDSSAQQITPNNAPQSAASDQKTEKSSMNAMCTAIAADNMDVFRTEAKSLKKNSTLSYLASNVIQAASLQDRKTTLEQSLKFLFEAFLLSQNAKDSACSPLLLKLKADELGTLKQAAKKK